GSWARRSHRSLSRMTRGVWYVQGPPKFGLVVSWQPVTRGVVLEPPPPEPGLGELPEQRTQQRVPVRGEPDQRPRVQRSRIGQRNRAGPRARGQRDVGASADRRLRRGR